jgi:beta-N-acetylhexosaminidase
MHDTHRPASAQPLAVVFGAPGPVLTADQRAFFRDANPLGLILFQRNCESPDQLRRLCADFRNAVGRADAPILIDHEGGVHQRMEPPVWPAFPAPAAFGRLYRRDPAAGLRAAGLNGAAIGSLLADHGISVDCAPLLDVPVASADPVIGERAFSSDPHDVALLADAFVQGMRAAGVVPVIKHIPGHGRATVDSHAARPVVDTDLATLDRTDFIPFRQLAGAPWAMVAHVVYSAVDAERPATISPLVVESLIRERLGFAGVLISDCIYMESLTGSLAERCASVLAAGLDIALSSHGDVQDWIPIAAAARPLTPAGAIRMAAGSQPANPTLVDVEASLAEIRHLLAL